MLGELTAALSRLNPTSASGADESSSTRDAARAGGTSAERGAERTGLFECPSCGAVFIAEDKRRCADCEVAVVRLGEAF
jgi:predicted RNA-binding Zn-ribbon protein involved in translation (DUF1610 family)